MMKRWLLSAAAAIGLSTVPALAQEQPEAGISVDKGEPVFQRIIAADRNEAIRQLTKDDLPAF